jgi:hypothetical protein
MAQRPWGDWLRGTLVASHESVEGDATRPDLTGTSYRGRETRTSVEADVRAALGASWSAGLLAGALRSERTLSDFVADLGSALSSTTPFVGGRSRAGRAGSRCLQGHRPRCSPRPVTCRSRRSGGRTTSSSSPPRSPTTQPRHARSRDCPAAAHGVRGSRTSAAHDVCAFEQLIEPCISTRVGRGRRRGGRRADPLEVHRDASERQTGGSRSSCIRVIERNVHDEEARCTVPPPPPVFVVSVVVVPGPVPLSATPPPPQARSPPSQ